MGKADFAESILSLVTSRERAVSIAGDLLEENDAGLHWGFWFSVARTACGQLWRQMSAAPFGMAGIALRAICVEFGLLLLWGAAFVLLFFGPAMDAFRAIFHHALPGWSTRWLPYLLSSLAACLQLGRWISRRYPGRQGAAALSLAIFHAAIGLCAGLVCWAIARAGGAAHVEITIFVPVAAWDGNIVRTLALVAMDLTVYPMLVLTGAVTASRAR